MGTTQRRYCAGGIRKSKDFINMLLDSSPQDLIIDPLIFKNSYKKKSKQCTHEHAIRGKCLKCGKEV